MLFIVTLFAAITKRRFSGLKRSSATILFHTYFIRIENLTLIYQNTFLSQEKRFFHRKQSSFRGHYVPFAKGSERKFLPLFSYTHKVCRVVWGDTCPLCGCIQAVCNCTCSVLYLLTSWTSTQ